MKKYRVNFYESEAGWSSDSWDTDYETEKEALDIVKETNDKSMGKDIVPSYYIRATYLGEVEV